MVFSKFEHKGSVHVLLVTGVCHDIRVVCSFPRDAAVLLCKRTFALSQHGSNVI